MLLPRPHYMSCPRLLCDHPTKDIIRVVINNLVVAHSTTPHYHYDAQLPAQITRITCPAPIGAPQINNSVTCLSYGPNWYSPIIQQTSSHWIPPTPHIRSVIH